ncbi:hypothetical protein DYBT9275_04037 [Dyadobacter sp. CECT 9275]|uniref:Uncharacterized protein n=1 Tax=Dyadobacter helix TaxID=2822344 RepID=A0A916JFZ7_9BACT|nr:hypothetical protein [Dyadobacter sp. CECT 9275]CAG5007402.1 hypothetical protein DYBT9275_04037 [Dyadobacter sp. CECT 9275]
MRIAVPLFISAFLIPLMLQGQSASKALAVDGASYPETEYKRATAYTQNLYNGRIYYLYDPKAEEHQFYVERKWEKGSVYYDGQRFDSIPMLYDIVRDELVIRSLQGDYMLLQSERVKYFDLMGHHFDRMITGKTIGPSMQTGFYDLIYKGKTRTLVRRKKERQEKIIEKKIIPLFPQKDFYYIFQNGMYHQVRSKKSVLALFPEHSRELKKVLREQHIKYRKNREAAISTMVARYDELAI